MLLDKVDMTNELSGGPQGLPQGFFLWGAVRAGIKTSGNLDLAMALAPTGGNAAVTYTKNRVVAAPVTVGRRHMLATDGRGSCSAGECGECELRYRAGGDRRLRENMCCGGRAERVHL